MKRSAESTEDTLGDLACMISAEVARAREALDVGTNPAAAVHEARRAIKRARALLRLAYPWPTNSPIDDTLRDASRALAVLRDADVLVLTAKDIRESSEFAKTNVVPSYLLESLEEERGQRFTESGSPAGPLRTADELLRSVTVEIGEPKATDVMAGQESTASSRTELLWAGLGASYASARARSDPTVGEGPVEERSHKLRKRVKDLRYQVEFLDTGHPKFGRLVRDLHHLTDLLGDSNDLATLSAHAVSADAMSEIERTALIAHIDDVKQALQSEAETLSARLFEEEPDSFVARIEAWVTPPQG